MSYRHLILGRPKDESRRLFPASDHRLIMPHQILIEANWTEARKLSSRLPYRAATALKCLSVLKKRSIRLRYQNRTNLNVYAGVRSDDDKWKLDGFVKNLLNQKRITNISAAVGQTTALDGSVFDSGYRTINAIAPREFGVSLSFRW